MKLFQRRERSVFTSEACLLPDFTPKEPLHREVQLREIAECIEPALRGAKPMNAFLWGAPGTGKTTCAKSVLVQASEESGRVTPIYINCWENNTRSAVLSKIAQAAEAPVPRRGISGEEIHARSVELIKKAGAVPVVVLDEFDQLVARGEDKVLYDLSRSDENHGVRFCVICITNDSSLLSRLDPRIKSSLSGKNVSFDKYSPLQLKDILRDRAGIAFKPGACGEEVIAMCAARGAKMGGDARVALQCLWLAGKQAEAKGDNGITNADVRQAFEQLADKIMQASPAPQWRLEQIVNALQNEVERELVKVVNENPGITTGKLYKEMQRVKPGITDRTVRNYLSDLQAKNVLKVELLEGRESPSGKGKTRRVRVAVG